MDSFFSIAVCGKCSIDRERTKRVEWGRCVHCLAAFCWFIQRVRNCSNEIQAIIYKYMRKRQFSQNAKCESFSSLTLGAFWTLCIRIKFGVWLKVKCASRSELCSILVWLYLVFLACSKTNCFFVGFISMVPVSASQSFFFLNSHANFRASLIINKTACTDEFCECTHPKNFALHTFNVYKHLLSSWKIGSMKKDQENHVGKQRTHRVL